MLTKEYVKVFESQGISNELIQRAMQGDRKSIKEIYEEIWFDIDAFQKKHITQEFANFLVFELDQKFIYDIDTKFTTQEMVDYSISLNKNPMQSCPEHLWTLDNVIRSMEIEANINNIDDALSIVCDIWELNLVVKKMPLDMTQLCDFTLKKYPKESFEWFNNESYNFFNYCSPEAIEEFLCSEHFCKHVDVADLDKTLFNAIFKKDKEGISFFFVIGLQTALLNAAQVHYSLLIKNLTSNWDRINHIAQKIIKKTIEHKIEASDTKEAESIKLKKFLHEIEGD